jgi:hypothetical protein
MTLTADHGRDPFLDVASRKRMTLLPDAAPSDGSIPVWLADIDLIRVSLAHAWHRAAERRLEAIADRIERLRRDGTTVQQLDFILGDRRTYYFPEDVNRMIEAGPWVGHGYSIQPLEWLRCRPLGGGVHVLEEHEQRICVIESPIDAASGPTRRRS